MLKGHAYNFGLSVAEMSKAEYEYLDVQMQAKLITTSMLIMQSTCESKTKYCNLILH